MAIIAAVPLIVVIYTILHGSTASPAVIENKIIGEPEVKCGLNGIEVYFATMHSFFGRMYVQGESDDPNCVRSFDGKDQQLYILKRLSNGEQQDLNFSLKFGECNMRRQRTLNPRGVASAFTLIVSFHPIFETEADRAYRIQCFFSETVKTLEANLEVSQLTTQLIEQEFTLPTCMYEIRESRNGPFVRFAHVGDEVWHVWHCDLEAGAMYGMLIHSCYVDDGQGKQVPIVDNKGCILESLLLSAIEYDEQAITAYAQTRVFKYSDKVQLYFTCTVQLCVKNDDGCDDVTPPVCNEAAYPSEMQPKQSSPQNAYYSGPSDLQRYGTGKEFFGPIDAARSILGGNSYVRSPLPQKSSAEIRSLKSRKLRTQRGIDLDDSLKRSKMYALEKRLDEMDLTAGVLVFPLEVQSSNSSLPGYKAVKEESHIIPPYPSSSLSSLLLFGTVMLICGAFYLITIFLVRHKISYITSFMNNKMS